MNWGVMQSEGNKSCPVGGWYGCRYLSFCFISVALSFFAEPGQRIVLEEQWWESWTPVVNSVAQTSHVEPRTSQTQWEVGPTQLWTLSANPTELHACVYVKHRTFCSHFYHNRGITVTFTRSVVMILGDCYMTACLLYYILCVISITQAFLVCLHVSG